MKRIVTVTLCVLLCCSLCACGKPSYLRIHIRAHSDLACDQEVKLAVRDAVVGYLTPYLVGKTSLAAAIGEARARTEEIGRVAIGVLREKGFSYGATVRVDREYFPTRSYGSLTLESGVYDALIIELGSGEGNNWWCVAYPPLCFGGGGNAEVRSWLWELISSLR